MIKECIENRFKEQLVRIWYTYKKTVHFQFCGRFSVAQNLAINHSIDTAQYNVSLFLLLFRMD